MKANHQRAHSSEPNYATDDFNNIESVENIYPAESINIINCITEQTILNTEKAGDPAQSAANDEYTQGQIYSLDNARLTRQSKSIDRRACKSRLTDRRSGSRVSANGEIQQDRREANRIANVNAIRLAHASK